MQTTEVINGRPVSIQWTRVELLSFDPTGDFEMWLLCGADESGTIYDAEGEFRKDGLRRIYKLEINN